MRGEKGIHLLIFKILTSYLGQELNYVANFKLKTPHRLKKFMVQMLNFLSIVMLFDYLIY